MLSPSFAGIYSTISAKPHALLTAAFNETIAYRVSHKFVSQYGLEGHEIVRATFVSWCF
jgi:hypothetical protein